MKSLIVTGSTTGRLYVQSPISLALFPAGWKFKILAAYVDSTISVRTPEAAQTLGGKIGFCYSTDVADNIDDTLTQPGEAADAAVTGRIINGVERAMWDDGLPLRWEQGGYGSSSGDYDTPAARIRTARISLCDTMIKGEVDEGYICYVVRIQGTSNTLYSFKENFYFYCGSDYEWAFMLKDECDTDESHVSIDVSAAVHVRVSKFTEPDVEQLGHGVYNIPTLPLCRTTLTKVSSSYRYGASSSYSEQTGATYPIKIPKSGLKITANPKYKRSLPVGYRAVFVKKTSSGLAAADDTVLANLNTATVTSFRPLYIPYAADTYVVFILVRRNTSYPDLSETKDWLVLTGGEITDTNGRLPNLTPVRFWDNWQTESTEGPKLHLLKYSDTTGLGYSTRMYGSCLRMRDVKRVVCGPKYSLFGSIYKQQADGSWVLYDSIYSINPGAPPDKFPNSIPRGGVPMIDLESYGFDGIAMIGIQCELEPYVSSNTQLPRQKSMGFLRAYDDVYANVFVEYKNSVKVEFERGLHPRIQENLRRMADFIIPVMKAGGYADQHDDVTTPADYPELYDVAPAWYAGGKYSNSLWQHVSDKSYVTAAQNPNSRVYKHYWPERNSSWPNSYAYGLICNSFAALMMGLKENYVNSALLRQDVNPLYKFDFLDFDCYKHEDLEKIKPGDWLVQAKSDAGHIMTVLEKVYVNGALVGINAVEAWAPFARHRNLLDPEYYRGIEDISFISSGSRIRGLSFQSIYECLGEPNKEYEGILRIKPEYINRLEDVFSMRTDWTAGTVMCDRGSDGIYTTRSTKILLSVSDNDATSLCIYHDVDDSGIPDEFVDEVLLKEIVDGSDADIQADSNGLRVVDLKDCYTAGSPSVKTSVDLTEGALHLVKVKVGDDEGSDVQETFYVAPNFEPPVRINGEATSEAVPGVTMTRLFFESREDNFVWASLIYEETGAPASPRKRYTLYTKEQAHTVSNEYAEYLRNRYWALRNIYSGWKYLDVPLTCEVTTTDTFTVGYKNGMFVYESPYGGTYLVCVRTFFFASIF